MFLDFSEIAWAQVVFIKMHDSLYIHIEIYIEIYLKMYIKIHLKGPENFWCLPWIIGSYKNTQFSARIETLLIDERIVNVLFFLIDQITAT